MSKRTVFAQNSWSGRIVRHTQSVSPDERELRLQRDVRRNPGVDRIVRALPPFTEVSLNHPPTDPHTSWLAPLNAPLGVNQNTIPDRVDLELPRVGRAFTLAEDGRNIVLFPACHRNPLCPPYPGLPPINIDNPCHPSSSFSAGRGGPFDPRDVPQVYSSRRPWIPYHRAPPLPRATQGDVPPDYLPVTDYYRWNYPGQPGRGGFVNRRLLVGLFKVRGDEERTALSYLRLLEDKMGAPLDLSPYDLPWYDPLDWEDTKGWSSWAEARDAIARTCLYTAELRAFGQWVDCRRRHLTVPRANSNLSADYSRFMGTWATTIPSRADWLELYHAEVPVYIATGLPDGHSLLYEGLRIGNFDADERYRENTYDAIHGFPNFTSAPKPIYRYQESNLSLQPAATPHSIRNPERLADLSFGSTSYKSWWASYIYQDSQVPRLYGDTLLVAGENPAQSKFWRDSHLLAPFLPPGQRVLKTELAPHPFFLLGLISRSRGVSRYMEIYDATNDRWWFERVFACGVKKRRMANAMAYLFSYPANSVIIHSDHPYPGRHPLFCRVSKAPLLNHLPATQPRLYLKSPPTPNSIIRPDYKWQYTNAREAGDENVDVDVAMEEETVVGQEFQHNDLDPGSYDSNPGQLQEDEVHDALYEPMPDAEELQLLKEQRHELAVEVDRRLFRPRKNLFSTELVPWKVPGLSVPAIVWPLRIANLYGDVEEKQIYNLLLDICHICPVDILLISSYQEVDTTRTVDVGLRNMEDGLWAWAFLQGVIVDERPMEVYPITSICGLTKALDISGWTELDADTRVKCWSILHATQEAPHPQGQFVRQVDLFGQHALTFGVEDNEKPEEIPPILSSLLLSQTAHDLPPHVLVPFPAVSSPRVEPASGSNVFVTLEGSFTWDQPGFSAHKATTKGPGATKGKGAMPLRLLGRSTERSHPDSRQRQHPRRGDAGPSSGHNKRRTRYQRKKNQRHSEQDPSKQVDMHTQERRGLRRKLHHLIEQLSTCCKITLPHVNLPFKDESSSGDDSDSQDEPDSAEYTLKLLTAWWDWLDDCHHVVDQYCMENPGLYDFGIVELCFGHLAKLQGVYGSDYRLCFKALQRRPHWVSRFQIEE